MAPSDVSIGDVLEKYRPNLQEYEELYRQLHKDPELSCRESNTAERAARHLSALKYDVHTNIGGYGVVGILRNGPGKTLLLRADMDALPLKEQSGLSYASSKTMEDGNGNLQPVMHACGHDMHVAMLLAVAEFSSSACKEWSGTLVYLFQPNEEQGGGAQAMIDDGLYKKHQIPRPDVILGQHLVGGMKAGLVLLSPSPVLAAGRHFLAKIYGKGGHAATPQDCVDPVVLASYIVIRLQTVISREIPPTEVGLITCGSIHSGDTGNVIPDYAELRINARAFRPELIEKITSAIGRVICAECTASDTPEKPEIATLISVPPTINDESTVESLRGFFSPIFGENLTEMKPGTASEDISNLAISEIPYAYWWIGCDDENKSSPSAGNHSPFFAPAIQPTLRTGVDAFMTAVVGFLSRKRVE